MDQRVDGAGGEYLQWQPLQQFRNQYSVICIHGGSNHTHLRAHAGAVQHGNIGHLAAGTAGGGDDDQHFCLVQRRHTGIQLIHVRGIRHGEHLGQIDDGTAADGDDTVKGQTADVLQDGLGHNVAGLTHAVLLLIHHMARQVQLPEIRLVDVLVCQDQIRLFELKPFRKLFARPVLIQRWLKYDLFHILTPLTLSSERWRAGQPLQCSLPSAQSVPGDSLLGQPRRIHL